MLLGQAGFKGIGADRDEALVQTVSDTYMELKNRRMLNRQTAACTTVHKRAVQNSGRRAAWGNQDL